MSEQKRSRRGIVLATAPLRCTHITELNYGLMRLIPRYRRNPRLFATPRNPRKFTKEFARRAALLGFPELRFHDLRGTHATLLLDRGGPVHVVAERIGDDPAVLLRN